MSITLPAAPATSPVSSSTFVAASVAQALAHVPYREVDLLRVMEKFAFWCVQHELLLENRTVFTEAVIADFVRDGVRGLKDASRANMRAQLRRMAEVLNGPAPQAEKLAPADPQRPYLKDEISSLRSWATSQKVHHRRDARLILALGFGAGLSAAEIGEIRESDVTADQGGVTVRVRAGRIRSVPVRRVWAARLEEVAGSSSDEYLVRPGRTSTPKNFISNIVARGKLSTGGPNTQRMRATWLLHHMNQGTPLLALLEASGLDSLEALTRYVRFLNPIDLAVSQEMLRN